MGHQRPDHGPRAHQQGIGSTESFMWGWQGMSHSIAMPGLAIQQEEPRPESWLTGRHCKPRGGRAKATPSTKSPTCIRKVFSTGASLPYTPHHLSYLGGIFSCVAIFRAHRTSARPLAAIVLIRTQHRRRRPCHHA